MTLYEERIQKIIDETIAAARVERFMRRWLSKEGGIQADDWIEISEQARYFKGVSVK